MLSRACLFCIGLVCCLVVRTVDADQRPHVVFLSPDDSNFWTMTAGFMEEVAADLDMDLEVRFDHDRHRFSYEQLAERVLNRERRPDYLVFMAKENVTERMLTLAHGAGVKAFTFNTEIPQAARAKLGLPRETLANWIGHVVPDNVQAGKVLAEILAGQARQRHAGEHGSATTMVALSGTLDSSAAKDRNLGLEGVADGKQVRLMQLIYADWSRQQAEEKTRVLLSRYPGTTAIWSASDGMAIGAIDAIRQAGKAPGQDIVVGGVDWEPQALAAIRRGELAVSLGRHFMGGGLVLLLLHDYHKGHDFASASSSPALKYQLEPATQSNVDRVERVMRPESWRRVDFRAFSRVHNPDLAGQALSANQVMDGFMAALAAGARASQQP
ncbi:MAG: ABC transporter substrate-binding protein [Marinobacter sp.]|uniref:ABC transporter substrate-binding protein n=1 Tax=Marinobacter sp. TaxID=50741 RepID=UPI003C3F49D2